MHLAVKYEKMYFRANLYKMVIIYNVFDP